MRAHQPYTEKEHSIMAKDPIKVGGPYVENENHVPNPTDIYSQFNTSGLGAHGKIEEVSPIFEVDKVKTAQEILGALDPKNDAVGSDRVLLPNQVDDNDQARDDIKAVATARVKKGVTIGEATPAEREAGLDGDEGVQAAVETERGNAAANSTGNRGAGQHEGTVASDAGKDDTSRVGSAGAKPAADKGATASDDTDKAKGSDAAKKTAAATPAKKTASSSNDK